MDTKPYSQNTVVIEICGGVAEVVWKPQGINLVIKDYNGDSDTPPEEVSYSALDVVDEEQTKPTWRG